MSVDILLITPPFTQLNTPYPATAYLKGFLGTQGIRSVQADLGIETMLCIFSRDGLSKVFETAAQQESQMDVATRRVYSNRGLYLSCIDETIRFLQGCNPTLAHRIAARNLLPEAGRFEMLADLDWAFGTMGVQDKARHVATLFLEDMSDFIRSTVDPWFGFTRYAERIARSAASFDTLNQALQAPETLTDEFMLDILRKYILENNPLLVALSVPFPGNLYAALRCGKWIRENCPSVRIALGGGYANTELRSVSDPRLFEYIDYLTLDDGEAPLRQLIQYLRGETGPENLKRTSRRVDEKVEYTEGRHIPDIRQAEAGTPDYEGLPLEHYISAIEVLNPMHRLWSDGRWNKLTMAHGCYWGKCTFCDVSLDYIARYEPLTATLICDRMQELTEKTGVTGFHFVDEAAPPSLMKALSVEILRRGMVVSWWTNIRFENGFTRDLCLLLARAGCIGVSGGLEVASDRLLTLIQKGITVGQVARVNRHFTEAGIMVHAYLMYGFPTQTDQETIDSMEMVRQMFECGVLQSAFWHLFTMTAHSPVGKDPAAFQVGRQEVGQAVFAINDLEHDDPLGAEHARYAYGLAKSLLNWMHGHGIDQPLHRWFDFPTPRPSVPKDVIRQSLEAVAYQPTTSSTRWIWLGAAPMLSIVGKSKKGTRWEQAEVRFETPRDNVVIRTEPKKGRWLCDFLSGKHGEPFTQAAAEADYHNAGLKDFEGFWDNRPVHTLYRAGLLRL
ncbi:MAG: radical SAM protein [Bacteroidetes bacterium]|nr:radical SAM protein [Bacteroidota bacterium]